MANVDAPFGARPVRYKSGAPYNGSVNLYYAPASYGTALYVGDPVYRTGTSDTRGVPEVNLAAAGDTPCPGNPITGFVVGFLPDPTNLSLTYRPASTLRYMLVADDPNLLFAMQASGTVAATDIGLNAVMIYTHSGSTYTGLSGAEVDFTTDTPAADASNQLTIDRLHDVDNNDFGANAVLLVRINQSTETPNTIGV